MLIFDPVRMARTNTLDFKPPMPNLLVQGVFNSILPFINRQILCGLEVEMDAESRRRLEDIRGERCLLLPNHPSEWDPCVMFDVGKQLGENFFFVAAREVFDYSYGLRGWFFQRLGVYSLVRGSNDRGSFKMSMDILSGNRGRLVIFVEGEISNQNETLLPLETGVVQLAFMAMNDLYKQAGKDVSKLPSVYVCPVGIRYVYEQKGLDAAIDRAVANLEEAVGIKAPAKERVVRLRDIASVVLNGCAAQVGFPLDENATMVQNVSALSGFLLTKLEQIINLAPDAGLSCLDRIRRIRNTLDRVLSAEHGDESGLYQKRLFAHQKAVLKNFYIDLERVVNFIAIYDGYLHDNMDAARYIELIRRFEREVFGSFQTAHPRKGVVTVAEPIDLKDCFEAFLKDKRAVINEIAETIERGIYAGIQTPEAKKLAEV